MAFNSRKKKAEVKDLDLMPFMNLFSILIPFLLSVAVFEKLGILEINLPERSPNSENQQPPDDMKLNLTVIITDEHITIGASGGFAPSIYYNQEIAYRSKSDGNAFVRPYVKDEVVTSPTDGKEMTLYERENIFLNYVVKQDSADPGQPQMVVTNHLGEAIVDSAGEWYDHVPRGAEKFQIIGETSLRTMKQNEAHLFKLNKLSAYDYLARELWRIQQMALKREEPPEDIDRLTILAGNETIYDKVIHTMDAAKYAGFSQLSLSLLEGG
jgi:biopolymer transport protein ExbD